jgi:hypothetical protein
MMKERMPSDFIPLYVLSPLIAALTSSAEMGNAVVFVVTFIQSIYVYMSEKDHVSSIYNVAALLCLQYVVHVTLSPLDNRFVLLH